MCLQPFGGDFRIRMVIQRAVYTGNAFYVLQDGADIVTHQHDGAFLVDFFQQCIKTSLKPFVNVRVGLIQDDDFRIGDECAS